MAGEGVAPPHPPILIPFLFQVGWGGGVSYSIPAYLGWPTMKFYRDTYEIPVLEYETH